VDGNGRAVIGSGPTGVFASVGTASPSPRNGDYRRTVDVFPDSTAGQMLRYISSGIAPVESSRPFCPAVSHHTRAATVDESGNGSRAALDRRIRNTDCPRQVLPWPVIGNHDRARDGRPEASSHTPTTLVRSRDTVHWRCDPYGIELEPSRRCGDHGRNDGSHPLVGSIVHSPTVATLGCAVPSGCCRSLVLAFRDFGLGLRGHPDPVAR